MESQDFNPTPSVMTNTQEMRFNISKDDFLDALNIVSKGMSSRPTIPILSGILLEACEDGTLQLRSTDLEVSIKHETAADIVASGVAVVHGKLMADIVKSLPDAAITIHFKDNVTTVSCMDVSFSLSSLNAADFPYFPDVDTPTSVELKSDELFSIVSKVSKSVSRDESRANLTGILFSVEEGKVNLVSTDMYRLAVANMDCPEDVEDFQAIIPGKIFEEVSRLSTSSETIKMGFADNQVVFRFGKTTFISRRIEGNYPPYKQLIPKEHRISAKVDTKTLLTSIKRVALLAAPNSSVQFSFSEDEQNLTISAKTQDVGAATEQIDIDIEGEDVVISFNPQFILDGLSMVGDEVLLEFQDSVKPGIMKDASSGNILYLAMPVRNS